MTELRELLAAAAARRGPVPAGAARRLLDGRHEGLPGWTVDRFGPAALVQSYGAEADVGVLDGLVAALLDGAGGAIAAIVHKHRGARGPEAEGRLVGGQLVAHGDARDPFAERVGRLIVEEDGLRFGVDLLYGVSVGLFLDARPLRAFVRGAAAGRRVLNLFSYTSAFGVAAAAGGARSTTNVDVVPSALARGEANYRLNDLPVDSRTHQRADAFDVLRRARRAGTMWDLVVLDPPPVPTDGIRRGGKRARGFDPLRDQEAAIRGALAVCAPGGIVLCVSAARGEQGFEEPLERALAGTGAAATPLDRGDDVPGARVEGMRAVAVALPAGAATAAPDM